MVNLPTDCEHFPHEIKPEPAWATPRSLIVTSLFGKKIFSPWKTYKGFVGNWDFRLDGVFDCGIDFSAKSILDAGCNVGIVAYEIAKRHPRSIHGIDHYRPAIKTARHIFMGVEIPHHFDVADLTQDRKLRGLLAPAYDIVLLMCVWEHIDRTRGAAIGDRVVATLAERCTGLFVSKSTSDKADAFTKLMARQGFDVLYGSDPSGRLFTYRRV
jgi:2-polyprenyl-3-methyl-5-hydroxy-6-metoxy-1,4-benzoquinol methylase